MGYSAATLAYAAGLFDGEGSVSIAYSLGGRDKTKRYHSLHVSLTSTTPEMLEWLKANFGGPIITQRKAQAGWKLASRWQISGKHAAEFLALIEPYLVLKRPQVAVALNFRQTLRGYNGQFGREPLTPEIEAQRELLRQELLQLNRRGVAAESEDQT